MYEHYIQFILIETNLHFDLFPSANFDKWEWARLVTSFNFAENIKYVLEISTWHSCPI